MFNVKISGTGMVLPKTIWSNQQIINKIYEHKEKAGLPKKEITAEQFEATTQIKERRYFNTDLGENLISVSIEAINQSLEKANWDPSTIDFIIFSSVSFCEDGTQKIPSSACKIQHAIKAWNCSIAYDMQAACSGWMFGVANGISLIQSKIAKRGIVVCTEKQQRGLDYTNEKSSMLIGDAATATLLEWSDEPKIFNLFCKTNLEGINQNIIRLDYEICTENESKRGYFSLDGKDVYKLGIENFVKLTFANKLSSGVENPDWYIYHQANGAMLEKVAEIAGVPKEKNLMTIQTLGNTTGATIPTVLHTYLENGTIKTGDKISFVAFGGGITMGCIMAEI
jgi:3-oxoacyl-[acyl-carrier-protein] synthase-3